jgi:hypothetical protein
MNIRHSRAGLAAAACVGVALLTASGAVSAPQNDAVKEAQPITSLPAVVDGTLDGAKTSSDEPVPSCTAVDGVVWYSVKAPHRGPMVARVKAGGELDAAITVLRVMRSHRRELTCRRTDRHGRGAVAWYAYAEGSYLIGVASRAESPEGPFQLTVAAAERAPRVPGEPLPAEGVRTTIDPILDSADAWTLDMQRGVTYRTNLTTPSGCLSLAIYRPGTVSFARERPAKVYRCGGYNVFTPGPDGGGVYSLVVRAKGTEPLTHSYRLQAAAAGPDDGAPGVRLENGQTVAASLFGRGIDAVDLYRMIVPRPNELTTIDLVQRPNVGFELHVLDEMGGAVAGTTGRGAQLLRKFLPPGRYYVVVRSPDKAGGKYTLRLRVRDVTTTAISVDGARVAEVLPATPVRLAVEVTSASHGGPVQIQLDCLDPLYGWHFSTMLHGRVDAAGTFSTDWTPPFVGHWRARARFVGTPFSSFSASDYVEVHAAEPLE